MALIQTFGIGLLVREVFARRTGNQAQKAYHRNLCCNSTRTRRICREDRSRAFTAEELRARLGGSSVRHSSRMLCTKTEKVDLEDVLKNEKW